MCEKFEAVYEMVSLFGKRADFLKMVRQGKLDKSNPIVRKGLKAREQLVQEHMKLVYKVTNQRAFYTCTYDELVQAGVLGLLRAIESFNPRLGFKFSTHAVSIIRFEVSTASKGERVIKIPSTLLSQITRLKKKVSSNSKLAIATAAKEMGLDDTQIGRVLLHWDEPASLDTMSFDPSSSELDFVGAA